MPSGVVALLSRVSHESNVVGQERHKVRKAASRSVSTSYFVARRRIAAVAIKSSAESYDRLR